MKKRIKTVIMIIVLLYVMWVFAGTMLVLKNINTALSGKETYDEMVMKHFYNPPGEFVKYVNVKFHFSLLGYNDGVIWLRREFAHEDESINHNFDSFSINVKRDGFRWYIYKYNSNP